MSRIVETAGAWWTGRAERERRLLLVLGLILAALVLWYGIWSPLQGLAREAQAHHARASADLLQAEAGAQEIARAEQTRGGRPGGAEALTRSAAVAGVRLQKTEPLPGGAVTMWTEPAPPRALFVWLVEARRELGVGVRVLEVQKAEDGVQGRITFEGAGG